MPLTSIAEFEATESPTPAETELIEACRAGQPCILNDGTRPTAPSDATQIRADLLRLLILGGTKDCGLHTSGVWLKGGYITDTLDLRFAKVRGRCVLDACRFDEQPQFAQTELAQLSLEGSHLPGLFAQGIKVEGDVFLSRLSAKGTVDVTGARIGGRLVCIHATFDGGLVKGVQQTAFLAQGIKVAHLLLSNLTAKGTVDIKGARIGGQLACAGATFDGGPGKGGVQQFALNAQRLHVAQGFIFRKVKSVKGRIHLAAAHVSDLADDAASWPTGADQVVLNGFSYDRIDGSAPLTLAARKAWLERGSRFDDRFFPQPYTQFAKVLREMGHAAEARLVLKEREAQLAAAAWEDRKKRYDAARTGDQSERADMGMIFLEMWAGRLWSGLIRRIAGYGYAPQRALYWMLGTIAVAFFLSLWTWNEGSFAPNSAVVITSQGWVETTSKDCLHLPFPDCDANPAATCSSVQGLDWDSFNALGYAADLVIPILDLGQNDAWAPSKDRGGWGKLLWWSRWVLAAIGWFVSALGVAAITGLVQKNQPD